MFRACLLRERVTEHRIPALGLLLGSLVLMHWPTPIVGDMAIPLKSCWGDATSGRHLHAEARRNFPDEGRRSGNARRNCRVAQSRSRHQCRRFKRLDSTDVCGSGGQIGKAEILAYCRCESGSVTAPKQGRQLSLQQSHPGTIPATKVNLFKAAGTDINAQDKYGTSTLMIAA